MTTKKAETEAIAAANAAAQSLRENPIVSGLREAIDSAIATVLSAVGPLAFLIWIARDDNDDVSDDLRTATAAFLAAVSEQEVDVQDLHKTYVEKTAAFKDAKSHAVALRLNAVGLWDNVIENLADSVFGGITKEQYLEVLGIVELEAAIAQIPNRGRFQGGAAITTDSETPRIREWAKKNWNKGPIKDGGRLPDGVREAYAKAMQETTKNTNK